MDAPCHADTLTVCGYLVNSYQNMQRFTELIFCYSSFKHSFNHPPNNKNRFFILTFLLKHILEIQNIPHPPYSEISLRQSNAWQLLKLWSKYLEIIFFKTRFCHILPMTWQGLTNNKRGKSHTTAYYFQAYSDPEFEY